MRRSNQLSYEATDVWNWSIVGVYVTVMSESTFRFSVVHNIVVSKIFTKIRLNFLCALQWLFHASRANLNYESTLLKDR